MFDDFVATINYYLDNTGWSIYDPEMAPDCLLEAPDGCIIELDGTCPHGKKSPLLALGLV